MWGRVVRLILIIAAAIAEIIKRRQTKLEMEDMQREQDAIGDDPADWIIDHFGGVSSDNSSDKDPVSTETNNHD